MDDEFIGVVTYSATFYYCKRSLFV